MHKLIAWIQGLTRHRLARWVVFGGIMLMMVRVVQGLPSTVEVDYQLGTAREGLKRAVMRYMDGEEQVRRVVFSFTGEPAGKMQTHKVQLLDGDYRVELDLTYSGGRTERLTRPLLVRGSGRVSVFLNR